MSLYIYMISANTAIKSEGCCHLPTYLLVLYRLPYFSHVLMSDYFTFETIDISILYRLLQTYNKSYKIVSKLANLLQLLGSIMSTMYKII